ncbi:MAG: Gfo/Idh/MocA family oxidoreductase [Pseudomonadota bacterium]
MGIIKAGVVGVGYLGKFHAEKYNSLKNCHLLGVVDTNESTAINVARDLTNVSAFKNYLDILDQVDAVSIVTTTPAHYEIARAFLSKGKHVLLEKPITSTTEQAEELISLADQNNCILQIGHIERFNPAVLAMDVYLQSPKFIESHRLSPFRERGTDVDVVLDLMIHDIDIILSIVNSDIEDIQASGMCVLSDAIDIANARITFKNNCVANVTASRVSNKTERKLRLFQENAYFSADLASHDLKIYTREEKKIDSHSLTYDKSDALLTEISQFLDCIESNSQPLVTGADGLRALRTADIINQKIQPQN